MRKKRNFIKKQAVKNKKTKASERNKNSNLITLDYLNESLDYDSGSGIFTWKERPAKHFKNKNNDGVGTWNTKFAHKTAGNMNAGGYIRITLMYKNFLAHRLAYFMYHGYLPENQIDHKDRVRHHNWITNLREASQQCQSRNSTISYLNKSGVVGVFYREDRDSWIAKITINQNAIGLGTFDNFNSAVMARWQGEKFYNFPNCCTDSTSYNYLKEKGLLDSDEILIYKNINKSGVTGVHKSKNAKKWSVQIRAGKTITIGSFNSFDEAAMARYKAEIKYNIKNKIGSPSAYIYLKNKGLI